MGTFLRQHLDAVALWVVVPVLCVVVALALAYLRSRWLERRRLRPKGVRARQDVIRHDRDRLAEYLGALSDSDPPVWQPAEFGLAAMAACQWDQAIAYFRQARTEATRAQLVPLCNQIGVCRYIRGHLDDALKDFEESAELARQYGDEQGRAPALGNIGVIHHDYGELGSALRQLSEALAIVRAHGDRRAAAPYLRNIGNVHRDMGELDKALEYCREALEISRSIGDNSGTASDLASIASIYRDKDQLDQALRHYEEALALSRETGDRWGMASSLGNIGSVHRYRGELYEALMFYEDALALARESGYQVGVATELGNIGLILAEKGLTVQAVRTLAESLTILQGVGVARGPRQALSGLSACDDRLGRERMQELLKQAGLADGSITDLLDRIDQLRMTRPRQRGRRRVRFALRRAVAGASS